MEDLDVNIPGVAVALQIRKQLEQEREHLCEVLAALREIPRPSEEPNGHDGE